MPDGALPIDAACPVPKFPLEALFVGKLSPPELELSPLLNMLPPVLLTAPDPPNNGPEVEGVLPKIEGFAEAVAL